MSRDEQILYLLAFGPTGTHSLAESLACPDRSIRRRLRRLIRDGYVFSPTRGIYRLTRLGRAVMEAEATPPRVGQASDRDDEATRGPIQRWIGRR